MTWYHQRCEDVDGVWTCRGWHYSGGSLYARFAGSTWWEDDLVSSKVWGRWRGLDLQRMALQWRQPICTLCRQHMVRRWPGIIKGVRTLTGFGLAEDGITVDADKMIKGQAQSSQCHQELPALASFAVTAVCRNFLLIWIRGPSKSRYTYPCLVNLKLWVLPAAPPGPFISVQVQNWTWGSSKRLGTAEG